MGANGMLGHRLCYQLKGKVDVYGTFRDSADSYIRFGIIRHTNTLENVQATNISDIENVLNKIKPQVVVNAIGIVKQRKESMDTIQSIKINSLFPHQLAKVCENIEARLIHISTDCVFSGTRGNYSEKDIPDPIDIYGKSKLLGEVDKLGALTIRTSIIGWEIDHKNGLIEWFATQRGKNIQGFRNAVYTGLTTSSLTNLIKYIIDNLPNLNGIYHVSSEPISKYDLLLKLRNVLGWKDISILPEDTFHCDRSLVSKRFKNETGWQAPSWENMIASLASEWETYKKWR